MKFNQTNALKTLGWGLVVYWLIVALSVSAIFLSGGDKTIALGLGIMSLIGASWCAGGAMLLLSRLGIAAICDKWKKGDRFAGVAWMIWVALPVPGILWVTWMVGAKFME